MRVVRSLWITRKAYGGRQEPPELLEAWDEWSVDGNYEGWQGACQKALEAVGSDLDAFRYIDLVIPDDTLDKAFQTTKVTAEAREAIP